MTVRKKLGRKAVLRADRRQRNPLCPVVAIGASAGGLEAFQQFFDRMPAESGIAFVLIQHLDPQHDTLIPELLSKHTAMKVERAADGARVESNHIYVIPPNATLSIEGCTFRVSPLPTGKDRRVVDHFFRSVAQDQNENVIGIVLSGTGSDGSLGIRAVKENGGLVIAQLPETAKFDGMPRSAISTGCVDLILSVAEMPGRILEYFRHLERLIEPSSANIEEQILESLPEIFSRLRKQTGHDFSRYKQSTLARRIQRRMQVAHIAAVSDYLSFLRKDASEVELLFKDLLIGVTQFFRDPECFAVVERKIVPKLFEGKSAKDQVRIWVPGCASGEEAYSFAILLHEYSQKLEEKPQLQVFATDLDSAALDRARKGRYSQDIAADLSTERLRRFFKAAGAFFEVNDELREICVFSPHNLIKDPPFSRLDLLSCRNVLIYLEADLQKKLLPLFHYALNPSGFLFLGPSENLASRSELFRTVDLKHRIFQRKPALLSSPHRVPVLETGQVTRLQVPVPPSLAMPKEQAATRSIERVILEEYAPASAVINNQGEVLYFSGRTGKYLEPPAGAPNNKLLSMARGNLRLELRSVLHRALNTGSQCVRQNIKVQAGRETESIDLIVRPLAELGGESQLYIVLFRELAAPAAVLESPADDFASLEHPVIKQLESELRTTKEDLQTTIEELETSNEELKSANEELLSMNEELQSANEELQTSKEEVQSANEELSRKIEEAEQAAAELRLAHDERARFAAIVQSSEDAIIGKTLEGVVTSWNPAAEKIFGYPPAEMIGQSIMKIIPPERHDEERYILSRLRQGERIEHYETERITKAGQRIVISLTSSPIRDPQGVVIGASKIARNITERRLAEDIQRRLAAVVESCDDAIITKTLDGIITSWNKAAERMYGYTSEEVVGRPVTILIPQDRSDEEPAILERLRRGEKIDHYETVRRRKDGSLLDISLTISPLRDSQGRIVGASKIARDITGRRQAAEARLRLAAIVESSDDAIISKTLEGTITSWNYGAQRIFGYAAEEVIGKHITILFPPDRLAEEEHVIGHIRRGERLEHFETVRRRKDGRLVHISLTVSPIRDPLGKVIGASKIARDITDQKRAADLLKQTAERLQLTLEAGGLGDWRWDAPTDLVTLSNPAAEMFGLPHDSPIAWGDLQALLHEEDRERARMALEETLRNRSRYYIEYRVTRPGGTLSWIAANGRGIYAPDGRILGMIGVVQDITEKRRTEDALRSNENRLRLFIEHAPAAIAMFDREMRYQAVSRRWLEDYSLKADILGRSHYEVFPDMPRHWKDVYQRGLKGEIQNSDGEAFERANGTIQYIKWEVRPWFESDERVGGLLIAAEEITEQVQAKLTLAKSEEQLRTMANSIPQLAWMADPDGRIFWYNERWFSYTGTTLEQMQGWGWQSVHDPEVLPRVMERWKHSLSTGEPFEMEFPLRGADGVFRWFLTRVSPIRDAAGMVTRWFGTNTDVDQVRKAREALKEETRILELLNETGRTIASQLDLNALLQQVTDAATQLSGARFGAFFYNVVNEQGEAFVLYTLSGAPREAFEKFGLPRATPLFSPTFHGEGVIRSDDILRDPRYGQMAPHHGMPKGHLPVRSYLAVPVVSRSGEVIGGLFFGHPDTGVFTEKSERLIVGVASQAAVAVDNARLYSAAQREIAERKRAEEALSQRVRLASLRAEISAAIASQDDLSAILRRCAESLVANINAAFARIWTVAEDGEWLKLQASAGQYTHLDGPHSRIKIGQFKIGRIAALRQPHLTNDVQADPEISDRNWAQAQGMVAFAGYPLEVEGKLTGVIAMFARQPLDEAVLHELSLIANLLSQWLQRRRSEDALREAQQKLSGYAEDLEKQVAERTASLKEALAQLEEFSYSVSHDLRAPLRAIAGYNDVFRKDFESQIPEEGKQYLDKISRSTARMERLVNDVLTMSRVARAELKLRSINLQHFIAEIAEQHASMQEPAATVRIDAEHSVLADEASLGQAVSNLLTNAVKFMPPGRKPEILVRSERINERVRLWVEDNGIGVAPHHRDKLFGMFQRLPATVKYEGTGIGLAIVRKAMERMGGAVGMEPNEPEGSRFWIEFKEG